MTPRNTRHYHHLKATWQKRHERAKHSLWEKHKDALLWFHEHVPTAGKLAHGALGSIMLLYSLFPPGMRDVSHDGQKSQIFSVRMRQDVLLVGDLQNVLPRTVEPLRPEQEERVLGILSERFGLPIKAEIDGIRLDRNYGLIGAEQHLMRYPGDTLATHFSSAEDAALFAKSGMAKGRGAWGYFAQNGGLTQKDVEREKYYIAVQTFLAPGYNQNVSTYYNFFKFRKMLVVNPENGHAMAAVIGDAGPAPWTGKHLGGSPEVMHYLERVDGKHKGPVLYFFIDDPEDKVLLGPIHVL